MSKLLRGVEGTFMVLVGLLMVAACTTAAAPTPTAAAKPTAAPAAKPTEAPAGKPAATASPAAKPAATASAKPAASADWKAQWDKVVAAAKQEGKVVVGGARGEGYRNAAFEFTKVYPEIKLEYSAAAGAEIGPKIVAERKSDLYLWDVYLGGSTTMLDPLIPEGVFEPLQPNLILPEVLDDSKWRQGFADGWQDAGNKYAYAFMGYLSFTALVNRDVPGATGLKTMDDLLDAKWKNMIVWQDPRIAGSGHKAGANLYLVKGADWYRRLLLNDIMPLKDARMALERLARGQVAVGIGTREDDEATFRNQGLLQNADYIDDGTIAAAHVAAGSGNVGAMDKPPHPNAQAVFINWLLSKPGQESYVAKTEIHSRRLDVPPGNDPKSMPRPELKYIDLGKEDRLNDLLAAQKLAEEVLK